jgi:hypothetical protein
MSVGRLFGIRTPSVPNNQAEMRRAAEASRQSVLARERSMSRNRDTGSLLGAAGEEQPQGQRRSLLG